MRGISLVNFCFFFLFFIGAGCVSKNVSVIPAKAPLSKTFVENGILISVGDAAKTTASAEMASGLTLNADETLVVVPVTMVSQATTNLQTNWRGCVLIQSATGYKFGASIPIMVSSTYSTPDYINTNERIEMRLLFRLKIADFPAKVILANGLTYDLNLD